MDLNIKGFGEESSKINYTGVNTLFFKLKLKNGILSKSFSSKAIDWLVAYSDPVSQWKAHPTYVLTEAIFLFGALIMIIHGSFINLVLLIGTHFKT